MEAATTDQEDTLEEESKKQPDTATFSLHVDNKKQASPSLFFSWCLSKDAVQWLKEKGVRHPLLFVTLMPAKHRDEEGNVTLWEEEHERAQRALYPLDKAAAYLQIRQPGDYLLMANIIWAMDDDTSLRNAIADRGNRIFERKSYRQEEYRHHLDNLNLGPYTRKDDEWLYNRLRHTTEVEIHVDKSLFAQLPRWLTWWCNLLLPKMKDSCAWRGRLPFVVFIQPILVGILIPFRAIVRLMCFIGLFLIGARWKGLSLRPIVHPFAMDTAMIVHDTEVAWERSAGLVRDIMRRPISWAILIGAGYWVYQIPWSVIGNILFSSRDTILILSVVIVVGTSIAWAMAYFSLWGNRGLTKEELERRQTERIRRQRREKQERYYEAALMPLVCEPTKETAPLPRGINRVPKTHRTVWVRLAAAKAELCKPFAG